MILLYLNYNKQDLIILNFRTLGPDFGTGLRKPDLGTGLWDWTLGPDFGTGLRHLGSLEIKNGGST